MITLTHSQVAKIEVLDKLLSAIDLDQLKQLSESEQVVAKLKGTQPDSHILINLIREHDTMFVDLAHVNAELVTLRADFQALVKVLHADVFTPRYNQDSNTIKSKYGIY